jgi:hypothetical protein
MQFCGFVEGTYEMLKEFSVSVLRISLGCKFDQHFQKNTADNAASNLLVIRYTMFGCVEGQTPANSPSSPFQ